MPKLFWTGLLAALALCHASAFAGQADAGLDAEQNLAKRSLELFGIKKPLESSAEGPHSGQDSLSAIELAAGLKASLVSEATDPMADMIALWPDDKDPALLYVCVEGFFPGRNNPHQAALQRIDLKKPPHENAETIVTGLKACDPVKRTPWGSLIIAEESGPDGALYEIMDPGSISAEDAVRVLDRASGAASDARVVKRKAIGNLSWEGVVVLGDGTLYFTDERAPQSGRPGGGLYKFVPTTPYQPEAGAITDPDKSPLASGSNYGFRAGGRDFGQGASIGRGAWLKINADDWSDRQGNINLAEAQYALGITGYYRPEDMDLDPLAAARGVVRLCWANTGRTTHGPGSLIEASAIYGEVLCLEDSPEPRAPSGAFPLVVRFLDGDPQANHFDNLAFQPVTGLLAVLEDGKTEVLTTEAELAELRGNDGWLCLPDGLDSDLASDGCVRFLSVKDTVAEPTGLVFDASGESAYMNLQHRASGKGALIKITGFKVRPR